VGEICDIMKNILGNCILLTFLLISIKTCDGESGFSSEDFSSANDVCEIYEDDSASQKHCKGNQPEWYYSAGLQKCLVRKRGCGLSKNSFPSKDACDKQCMGRNRVCQMELQSGLCRADLTRYFFNMTSGDCEEFRYTGCGGNSNRFMSEKACWSTCGGYLSLSKELCHLRPEIGDCEDEEQMWYFEKALGVCRSFRYSGCGGNRNRFRTKMACEDLKDLCLNT